jgi:hypothetical protein
MGWSHAPVTDVGVDEEFNEEDAILSLEDLVSVASRTEGK